MQPNNGTETQAPKSWGDFQARKLAKAIEGQTTPVMDAVLSHGIRDATSRPGQALSEALTQSISIVKERKKRKPKPPVEPKEVALADVLKQAVDIAMSRRGRVAQEDAIREQTLLEVLASAMKRAS